MIIFVSLEGYLVYKHNPTLWYSLNICVNIQLFEMTPIFYLYPFEVFQLIKKPNKIYSTMINSISVLIASNCLILIESASNI